MPTTLSYRAEDDVVASLDKLCCATDRDRTYHIARALKRYLEAELWHVEAVQEGIDDIEAGRTIPLEDVKAIWLKKANDRAN